MYIQPFNYGDTHSTFQNITEQTIREIEALENDYVLKASPVELEEYYVSKVKITPLTLSAEQRYIDNQKNTEIDVSHDIRRVGGIFGNKRIVVPGTSLDIAIPFTGDPDLWTTTAFHLQLFRATRNLRSAMPLWCSTFVFRMTHQKLNSCKAEIERGGQIPQ